MQSRVHKATCKLCRTVRLWQAGLQLVNDLARWIRLQQQYQAFVDFAVLQKSYLADVQTGAAELMGHGAIFVEKAPKLSGTRGAALVAAASKSYMCAASPSNASPCSPSIHNYFFFQRAMQIQGHPSLHVFLKSKRLGSLCSLLVRGRHGSSGASMRIDRMLNNWQNTVTPFLSLRMFSACAPLAFRK